MAKSDVQIDDKRMKAAIGIAKRNLVNFRKTVLSTADDEVLPADFHFDWSEKLLHGTMLLTSPPSYLKKMRMYQKLTVLY